MSLKGLHTYTCSGLAYAGYTTPTDMLTFQGSSTRVCRINQAGFRIGSSAALLYRLHFIIRSAANTGGTAATQTAVKLNSASPAATAVVKLYSVIPDALGNSLGTVGVATAMSPSSLTTVAPTAYFMSNFLTQPSSITSTQGVTLNSASEFFCLNGDTSALPTGAAIQWEISWTESPV